MSFALLPFQRRGCRRIYRFGGRALLADEQGLGKTIQALYWISRIPSRRPVVIVTPASVKYTWQVEAKDHFGLRAEVLEGNCPKGRQRECPGSIIIINYDILRSWMPNLKRWGPKVVIFDECQYIKNFTALRTKASIRLAKKAVSVLGLSGTPLTNHPVDLWAPLHVIRPDLFEDRLHFLWRYCKPRHTRWGWKFDGASRLGELHRILKTECMIRRLKVQVLPELPAKTEKVIPFRVAHYDQYIEARDDFLHWLRTINPAKAARAKRSQALTKVGYLLRLCARLKLPWIVKWIQEFQAANPESKLVAMTMNTFVIDHLRQAFPGSVFIDGRVTGRKRLETVRQFQSNKRTKLFWGNWKAAGVGLTLTAADTLVSLDFPWTPGDLLQGQDRIHRIGQKRKVMIGYFLALGTIEVNLMRGLQRKKMILNAVLDGKRSIKDFDVFDVLLEEMKNESKD